jgi:hypothetical protein
LSYAIGAIWLLVMPSHARIHTHIVPRIFFLSYFVVIFVVVMGITGIPGQDVPDQLSCGNSRVTRGPRSSCRLWPRKIHTVESVKLRTVAVAPKAA